MNDNTRRCADCGELMEGIIDVMFHSQDCEPVLRAQDLTRSEQDTLLYVESRLVDHGGELDLEQMNGEDQQNLKLFQAAGLLEATGEYTRSRRTMQIERFTNAAWDLVRDCRQMRAARNVEDQVNVGFPPGVVEA